MCNAGFGSAGNFLESDISNEMNMLSVNFPAVTQMTYEFGRKFMDRGHGGVVLVSSILALQGLPRSAHYAATKAFVHTLGEVLNEEWRGSGVDLLIVTPGPVESGFSARSKIQLRRAASPEVVAQHSLEALGRKNIIHPGWLANLMNLSLVTAPRRIRVKIMGVIMRSMTRHLPN